jgi:hypothetical protein
MSISGSNSEDWDIIGQFCAIINFCNIKSCNYCIFLIFFNRSLNKTMRIYVL